MTDTDAGAPSLPVFRKDLVVVLDVFRAFAEKHRVEVSEATQYLADLFCRRACPLSLLMYDGLPQIVREAEQSSLWIDFFNERWFDQALLDKIGVAAGLLVQGSKHDVTDFGMLRTDVVAAVPDLDLA